MKNKIPHKIILDDRIPEGIILVTPSRNISFLLNQIDRIHKETHAKIANETDMARRIHDEKLHLRVLSG